ncbi:MAG: hypothetical protein JNM56_17985 [Planctomycetia bacterium]|nr:hypothetical protein [Planctomycetia bacterium]
MPRTRATRQSTARQGVVLLVVISLLVLFFVVGLAFVIYSSAQATNARVFRETETVDHPEMDPEMLLSYFMGQFIYGSDNPNSALAADPIACALGPNMYGTANSTVPFGGGPNGGVPYTYPDNRNLYLGAIKAGNLDFYDPATGQRQTFNGTDGAVLIPSYARFDPATGNMQRLGRPASLGATADMGGDVKNLTWSPGFFIPGTQNAPRFAGNDSHWMDLGFAVTTSADGRRFKPLFAPLIIDMDNKVNVNVHGNIQWHTNGTTVGGTDPITGRHSSHQGWGPWEVNLERVLTARDNTTAETAGTHAEARRIFIGDLNSSYNRIRTGIGRYRTRNGNVGGAWGLGDRQLVDHWAVRGPFYMPTNYDGAAGNATTNGIPRFPGHWDGAVPRTSPSIGYVPSFSAFPYYTGDYDGGKRSASANTGLLNHPVKFNFFDPPSTSFFGDGQGTIYDVRDLEAVLRHGDTNSPAMSCDLFHACSQSLASAKARRLITTHAFDWDVPGITPVTQPDPADIYQLAGGQPYPTGTSFNAEPYDGAGARVRFGRVNLNRDLARGKMGNMKQQHDDASWWHRGAYPPIAVRSVTNPLRPWEAPIEMSLGGVDYLAAGALITGVTPAAQFIRAVQARTFFAKDIFAYARLVTGAPDPNDPAVWGAITPEQKNALRWLAQLAVNIVDYIDIDENMTPFRWKDPDAANPNGEWVYGVELPRLVVNEAYGEIVNHKDDEPSTVTQATKDYRVRFWVEMNNPLHEAPRAWNASGPWGGAVGVSGMQFHSLPLSEGGAARLWVADQPGRPGYAVYKLVVCGRDPLPANPGNVQGLPDTTTTPDIVKCEVDRWYDRNLYNTTMAPVDPDPQLYTVGQSYALWSEELNLVRPMDKYPKGADQDNYGYYVVGPMEDWPGTANPKPKATLRLKTVKEIEDDIKQKNPTWTQAQITDERRNNLKVGDKYGLAYELPKATDPASLGAHSVLLQRLCTPSMPPNNDPNSPQYNPYVTVDYMTGVPVHDRLKVTDAAGSRRPAMHMANDPKQAYSVGRNQPYAAHVSQQIKQKPLTELADQPQHTLFDLNVQKLDAEPPMGTGREAQDAGGRLAGFAFHWLCHADRPLISPMELLEVAACKPHELTQQFAQGPPNEEPTSLFQHRAPWFDPAARIYRLLEILSCTPQLAYNPVGGRVIGKININTIFDREVFHALFDPQANNLFTMQDVDKAYDKMMASRSPMLTPTGNDRPFRGLSFDPAGGIDDTLLRADPFDDPALPPQQRRRLLQPEVIDPARNANRGHPYMKYEMLRKVANNITTRSNVFAVFLTVGFFEVNAAGQPIAEVRRNEGRHVRHRMFAVVDRSSMSIGFNGTARQIIANTPGPRPMTTWINIPPVGHGVGGSLVDAQLPHYSGTYEGTAWSIGTGTHLFVDSGINQELVLVNSTFSSNGSTLFRAPFTKPHATRVAVSRADTIPGYPGPQSRFDIRNPVFNAVVRYFSITE